MVGDRDVTPVAKWFRYHADQSYQSGNGWSQNSMGTWTYDEQTAEFLPYNRQGEPDEYGAFVILFENGNMYWEREEEGMKVAVTLSPITEMPMAPKDSISGNWQLVSVLQDGQESTEGHDLPKELFVSWGGTYRATKADGSQARGFWHMDPHAAEFHMVDWNREVDFMAFDVSFDNDLVKMVPWKDRSLTYTYQRN